MYKEIKKCVWNDSEIYYNTGVGYIFTFEGAEGGLFWIERETEQQHLDSISYIPLDHLDEFILFTKFVKKRIKEWQESPEGKKRIKEIEREENIMQGDAEVSNLVS